MPDTSTIRATVSTCPGELRLERYRSLQHVGSILLHFHTMSDDVIRLSWRNCIDATTSPTSVHVTLRGKQDGCALDLTHSRFRTEEERRWHDAMWTHSLEHLSRLVSR